MWKKVAPKLHHAAAGPRSSPGTRTTEKCVKPVFPQACRNNGFRGDRARWPNPTCAPGVTPFWFWAMSFPRWWCLPGTIGKSTSGFGKSKCGFGKSQYEFWKFWFWISKILFWISWILFRPLVFGPLSDPFWDHFSVRNLVPKMVLSGVTESFFNVVNSKKHAPKRGSQNRAILVHEMDASWAHKWTKIAPFMNQKWTVLWTSFWRVFVWFHHVKLRFRDTKIDHFVYQIEKRRVFDFVHPHLDFVHPHVENVHPHLEVCTSPYRDMYILVWSNVHAHSEIFTIPFGYVHLHLKVCASSRLDVTSPLKWKWGFAQIHHFVSGPSRTCAPRAGPLGSAAAWCNLGSTLFWFLQKKRRRVPGNLGIGFSKPTWRFLNPH